MKLTRRQHWLLIKFHLKQVEDYQINTNGDFVFEMQVNGQNVEPEVQELIDLELIGPGDEEDDLYEIRADEWWADELVLTPKALDYLENPDLLEDDNDPETDPA